MSLAWKKEESCLTRLPGSFWASLAMSSLLAGIVVSMSTRKTAWRLPRSPCSFRLPGRSPAEAVGNFVDPLVRAVSCVTRTPLVVSSGGRNLLGKVHTLAWDRLQPVRVRRSDGSHLALDLALQYEIIHIPDDRYRGPYKVSTRGYMHAVQASDDVEVLAFHWHPSGNPHAADPHMHVGSSELNPGGVLSRKTHIPTARMSVENVLRFCIQELGVRPLRDDWSAVLADSEDLFHMWATWTTAPAPQEK